MFLCFTRPATPQSSTLSLHDALPIYPYDLTLDGQGHLYVAEFGNSRIQKFDLAGNSLATWGLNGRRPGQLFNPWGVVRDRSEEHTSELQSHSDLVCRLLLEKKK